MSENFTVDGLDSTSELLVEYGLNSVAVGSGLKELSDSDEYLDNKLYENTIDSSNVSISTTSNDAEIEATINIGGGTEVEPNDQISEFGAFLNDGTMLYRTVRDPVEISDGERITFRFTFSFVNTE